uniref:RRM domain-containing protein n=1 Tax=Arcella intermedia TaxID=1963864 RepID=A0A6B2L9Y4_9EUKA
MPIKVLATFNKVKEISEDVAFIGSVLEGSKILEVSGDVIKRRLPVPTENTIDSRSLFVSGFPKARAEFKYLKLFFEKFGKVLSIRIKKRSNFEPNPHCFVEFENIESLNNVQTTPLKWDQFTLKVLPKEEYIQNVRAMITSNLVIKVDNIISDTLDWRKIKTLFNQFGSNYTDVKSGIAYIQFNKLSGAQKALTQLKESQLQVDGTTLTGNILTGHEEINYWLYKSSHPPIQGKINKCKRLKKPNEDSSYETLLTKAQAELQKTDPELKLNINYTNTNPNPNNS